MKNFPLHKMFPRNIFPNIWKEHHIYKEQKKRWGLSLFDAKGKLVYTEDEKDWAKYGYRGDVHIYWESLSRGVHFDKTEDCDGKIVEIEGIEYELRKR